MVKPLDINLYHSLHLYIRSGQDFFCYKCKRDFVRSSLHVLRFFPSMRQMPPTFVPGNNIAMKVPSHEYGGTVDL